MELVLATDSKNPSARRCNIEMKRQQGQLTPLDCDYAGAWQGRMQLEMTSLSYNHGGYNHELRHIYGHRQWPFAAACKREKGVNRTIQSLLYYEWLDSSVRYGCKLEKYSDMFVLSRANIRRRIFSATCVNSRKFYVYKCWTNCFNKPNQISDGICRPYVAFTRTNSFTEAYTRTYMFTKWP